MAALEAEAQAAAEQAEVEGGKRPGVPDDKAQRNFTDTESRIIPAPGGKDFLQAYNCQAVVDSAHQVIVAARATNQTSDKQQAVAMMEETIDNVGASPGKYPPMLALLGKGSQRALRSGRGPVRRAGADPPRPGCATRAPRSHTQPSVSQGPDATEVQTRHRALRLADANCGAGIRPDQAWPGIPAVLAAGTEEGERRMSLVCTGHNLLKLFRFAVNLHRKARGNEPAQRIRNFCRGSERGAIRKATWGLAGATGTISCRDPLSLTRKRR